MTAETESSTTNAAMQLVDKLSYRTELVAHAISVLANWMHLTAETLAESPKGK